MSEAPRRTSAVEGLSPDARSALEAVGARFQGILDVSPAAIYVKDGSGRYLLINRAFEEVTGQPRHQILGATDEALFPPPVVAELSRNDAAALAGAGPRQWEEVLPGPDGSSRTFVAQKYPLTSLMGDRTYLCGILTDITERKQMEEALLRAKREAEEANGAKNEFLSRMSHELRTPLNVIIGFAQLLDLDDLEPDHQESVGQIIKAGRHLLGIIDDVLDISRIESNRMALSVESVPLARVIEEVVDLVRPLATPRDVSVGMGAVPAGTHVMVDQQRLKQVLLNLASNGIKYNRPGGSVVIAAGQRSADEVRVTVSDSGPGIAPELLSRLFNAFDRLGAESTSVEGTGLGLALSKRLVEAMAGRIGVDSEPGAGSVFWVDLKLGQEAEADADAAAPAAVLEGAVSGSVLYVEDNLSNLRLVEKILERRPGLRLLPAMQGRLGVELAEEHQPDLILVDLHLPDISGEMVLRALKANPVTAGIPVVIATADATPGQVRRLLDAGAHAYLTKPLDVLEFLGLVDGILSPAEG